MSNQNTILTPQAVIDQHVLAAAREILSYTSPLVRRKDRPTVEFDACASAVLIRARNDRFVVTAGHVFRDNLPKQLGIAIGSTFHILSGELAYADNSNDDVYGLIDIAVWKLSDELANDLLGTFKFLELTALNLQHTVSQKPHYLMVGFPVSHAKTRDAGTRIKAKPFIFLTAETDHELYQRLKYAKDVNITLDYRKGAIHSFGRNTSNQGPDLVGVSGSGLWFLPSLLGDSETVPFQLVGIMSTWDKPHNVVTATRIHLVGEILARKFNIHI